MVGGATETLVWWIFISARGQRLEFFRRPQGVDILGPMSYFEGLYCTSRRSTRCVVSSVRLRCWLTRTRVGSLAQPIMFSLTGRPCFSLNTLFTGCFSTACVPMSYPSSALFMWLAHFWFFGFYFLGWSDSFVSVVDCGCSVKGSSRRRLRASVLELVVYFSYSTQQHFFLCVSLLTCSYCLKPVEDDVHFYIYEYIYVFITLLEAHL